MTIEERLSNLEKGYKELCHVHDKNKQMHLALKTTLENIMANLKDQSNIIKDQTKLIQGEQLINEQSMKLHQDTQQRLQKLEEN